MSTLALVLLAFVCGTSPETQQRLEELARTVRARTRLSTQAVGEQPPTTRFANDFLFVRADDVTVPYDDSVDLEGSTIHFTRRNATTFAVTRTALQYDGDAGALFTAFGRGETLKTLPLTKFAFPFGNATHNELTLSVTRGIHFTREPALPAETIQLLETVFSHTPLLSPLYDYTASPAGWPNVYVKETAQSLTITWRAQSTGIVDYDLQAVLLPSGDFRFSYKRVHNLAWGGVVVNAGNPAWLQQKTKLMQAFDPGGADVDPSYGAARGMLDITSIEVSRVTGTTMLELRLHLWEAIDPSKLNDGTSYMVVLGASMNRVELVVRKRGGHAYRLPGQRELVDSPAARIEGGDVVMYVPEELLELSGRSLTMWAFSSSLAVADSMSTTVNLGSAAAPLETDFSALTSLEAVHPLVETFRLGTVNVHGIWERLQAEFGYSGDDIDAVMVFPAFLNDIILGPHGAYAWFGNHGANGVSFSGNKTAPRVPTLIHMNSTHAFGGQQRLQIMLHELGHRWLYFFDIREDGRNRRALNPVSPHPAHWVHMPAAFAARSASDSSAMGGGVFADNGNGTFTTAASPSWFGFAWHELYLMGLARTEEVQPWFYLRNSGLGDQYYPPAGKTVTAERVDVGVQQIIEAMGPRDPAFDKSQKTFRVLFVVLERTPDTVLTDSFRTDFEKVFADAVGGRASLITTVSLAAPVASFDVRGSQFTDTSTSVPLSWQWNFGDGNTSSARNPLHTFAQPGTYTITLTVTNGKGTSTTSRVVTVGVGPKRRVVGR